MPLNLPPIPHGMPYHHLPLAFLDIGGSELMFILVVVLLLFGGKKLPDFARGLGKSVREFKKASAGVEAEIKRAMEEPPQYEPPRPPPAPTPQIAPTAAPAANDAPPPSAPPHEKLGD